MLRLEPNEEELDSSILGRGEDDEGPEVIVPGCHEGEDAKRGEWRSHLREDNAPVDAEFGGAIDTRSIHELGRQRFDKLLHQENAKRVHHRREDERPERIDKSKFYDQQIIRNHDHLKRNHDLYEDDSERQVFAFEMIFGEDITSIGTGEECDEDTRDGNNETVENIALNWDIFIAQDTGVMSEAWFLRKEIGRGLAQFRICLKGRNNNIEER